MKILVTNDDGIDSPGIRALAEAMSRVGEVLVVAPDKEQSGVGTARSLHNGIAAAERTSAIEGARAYAVSGTPSDCVLLGLGPLAEGEIDLVVSGINTGANVGIGVLGSGTAMATPDGLGSKDTVNCHVSEQTWTPGPERVAFPPRRHGFRIVGAWHGGR